MGILNGPRINFWGGIRSNVCVANNSDTVPQTPSADEKTLLNVTAAQVGPDGQSMSDDAIIAMMRAPGPKGYYTGGGWNYYGDHQVTFYQAVVSSSGAPGEMTTSSTIASEPVYLLGSVDPKTGQGPYMSSCMVDLDPTAAISTQIFIGGLMIGPADNPKLHIVEDVVASSRSVFAVTADVITPTENNAPAVLRQYYRDPDGPGSAYASGTFQVTFKKSSVVSADMSDPAIAAIMNAADMDGIVLRFQMFEMFPELTTDELVAAYEANQNPSNPSVGRVVGTIAPYFPGEPMTDAPGRELMMQSTNLVGYFEVDEQNNRMSLDALALYPKGYFRSDRKNFGSAYPIEPNVDYGTNTLAAGKARVTFSANPNDYYLYGGILDIPLGSNTSEVVQNEVVIKGANTVTLPPKPGQVPAGPPTGITTSFAAKESFVRIFGDPRNIYIDDHKGPLTLTFNITVLGKPTPFFDEPGGNVQISVVSGTTGTLPDGDFLTFPSKVVVAQNTTQFTMTIEDNGDESKFGFMTLVLTGDQGGTYFFNVRKYPKTDFGIPAGSTISWDQAYEYSLRYFYVTFPAMNMRIPLNEQGVIEATSDAIQRRISDEYRPTTLYMPITRSMTPSQRALLTQFLNNQPWQPLDGSVALEKLAPPASAAPKQQYFSR